MSALLKMTRDFLNGLILNPSSNSYSVLFVDGKTMSVSGSFDFPLNGTMKALQEKVSEVAQKSGFNYTWTLGIHVNSSGLPLSESNRLEFNSIRDLLTWVVPLSSLPYSETDTVARVLQMCKENPHLLCHPDSTRSEHPPLQPGKNAHFALAVKTEPVELAATASAATEQPSTPPAHEVHIDVDSVATDRKEPPPNENLNLSNLRALDLPPHTYVTYGPYTHRPLNPLEPGPWVLYPPTTTAATGESTPPGNKSPRPIYKTHIYRICSKGKGLWFPLPSTATTATGESMSPEKTSPISVDIRDEGGKPWKTLFFDVNTTIANVQEKVEQEARGTYPDCTVRPEVQIRESSIDNKGDNHLDSVLYRNLADEILKQPGAYTLARFLEMCKERYVPLGFLDRREVPQGRYPLFPDFALTARIEPVKKEEKS